MGDLLSGLLARISEFGYAMRCESRILFPVASANRWKLELLAPLGTDNRPGTGSVFLKAPAKTENTEQIKNNTIL